VTGDSSARRSDLRSVQNSVPKLALICSVILMSVLCTGCPQIGDPVSRSILVKDTVAAIEVELVLDQSQWHHGFDPEEYKVWLSERSDVWIEEQLQDYVGQEEGGVKLLLVDADRFAGTFRMEPAATLIINDSMGTRPYHHLSTLILRQADETRTYTGDKDIRGLFQRIENGVWELRTTDVLPPSVIADTRLPTFENFPGEIFSASPAEVNLASHPDGEMFRTRLTDTFTDDTRFAGHYRIVEIGCGTACQSIWAVDLIDGSVYSLFTASSGVAYRPDSRLIVENDPAFFEEMLDTSTVAEVEDYMRTYGSPEFWTEENGLFEKMDSIDISIDPVSKLLVAE
jgi:hypothetical protein